jgi:hypothetical protein
LPLQVAVKEGALAELRCRLLARDTVLASSTQGLQRQLVEAAQAAAAAERRGLGAEASRRELEGVVRSKNNLVRELQLRLEDTAAAAADAAALSAGEGVAAARQRESCAQSE